MLGTGATIGGAGTFAYLSDDEDFDTTFEAGSLKLSVDSETLEFTDMDEGETGEATVTLCNSGTLDINNVILTGVDLTGGETQVAKALEVKTVQFGGGQFSISDVATDDNGNGIIDLHDVANTLSDVSITDNTGGETLLDDNDTSGEKGECKTLKMVVQIDYSNLEDGMGGEDVVAKVNLQADQEPINN